MHFARLQYVFFSICNLLLYWIATLRWFLNKLWSIIKLANFCIIFYADVKVVYTLTSPLISPLGDQPSRTIVTANSGLFNVFHTIFFLPTKKKVIVIPNTRRLSIQRETYSYCHSQLWFHSLRDQFRSLRRSTFSHDSHRLLRHVQVVEQHAHEVIVVACVLVRLKGNVDLPTAPRSTPSLAYHCYTRMNHVSLTMAACLYFWSDSITFPYCEWILGERTLGRRSATFTLQRSKISQERSKIIGVKSSFNHFFLQKHE